MIRYVVANRLARAARPDYSPVREMVEKSVVDAWMAEVKAKGIHSIICLLADEHLQLYVALERDLPSYYRRHGFAVEHVPVVDHKSPPLDAGELARIAHAYAALPKPVLVHCSAGIGRTGSAVAYLTQRFEQDDRAEPDSSPTRPAG